MSAPDGASINLSTLQRLLKVPSDEHLASRFHGLTEKLKATPPGELRRDLVEQVLAYGSEFKRRVELNPPHYDPAGTFHEGNAVDVGRAAIAQCVEHICAQLRLEMEFPSMEEELRIRTVSAMNGADPTGIRIRGWKRIVRRLDRVRLVDLLDRSGPLFQSATTNDERISIGLAFLAAHDEVSRRLAEGQSRNVGRQHAEPLND